MKIIPILLLLAAAAVLGWIAWKAPEPTYEVPTVEAFEPTEVPGAIIGELPDGHVVRAFDVEGMCCNGCTAKLYDSVRKVPGVERAAVSFDSGVAFAVVPESLDLGALEAALNFDKYTAQAKP